MTTGLAINWLVLASKDLRLKSISYPSHYIWPLDIYHLIHIQKISRLSNANLKCKVNPDG